MYCNDYPFQVDPLEKRTISVLTKLDKCSEGDVKSKLEELRSTGARFVLVRNRTPEEIAMETHWDKVRLINHISSNLVSFSSSYRSVNLSMSQNMLQFFDDFLFFFHDNVQVLVELAISFDFLLSAKVLNNFR